jgi:hypothetical protein
MTGEEAISYFDKLPGLLADEGTRTLVVDVEEYRAALAALYGMESALDGLLSREQNMRYRVKALEAVAEVLRPLYEAMSEVMGDD